MTNIFLMREGLGLEDRLTFHWAYVLNAVPRLGQRVVERIAERAGLPATEDVLAIAAKLPWWVSVGLAAVSFLVLHTIAGREIAPATSTQDIGRIASAQIFKTLAGFGQFIVPLLFLAGALASVLGQKKRERLVTQVAESLSPTR